MLSPALILGVVLLGGTAPATSAPTSTQVILLGTGTPRADPEAWGPAVAIVVNGQAYLVDCGPGVVRRAAAAAVRWDLPALKAKQLRTVFITHLHSDHTLGYPDLIFSPWVLGRTEPLEAYGPRGLQAMTEHVEQAWTEDVKVRTQGLEKGNLTGYQVHAHEIAPGLVYQDANVTVRAFAVPHGSWDQAFGYRFETADRTIVLSGDTGPTPAIAKACHGCDILLHEVYSAAAIPSKPPDWQKYMRSFHTSTLELADEATAAKPGLLVLYHQLFDGDATGDKLVAEIQAHYGGRVVSGKDLDRYPLP